MRRRIAFALRRRCLRRAEQRMVWSGFCAQKLLIIIIHKSSFTHHEGRETLYLELKITKEPWAPLEVLSERSDETKLRGLSLFAACLFVFLFSHTRRCIIYVDEIIFMPCGDNAEPGSQRTDCMHICSLIQTKTVFSCIFDFPGPSTLIPILDPILDPLVSLLKRAAAEHARER